MNIMTSKANQRNVILCYTNFERPIAYNDASDRLGQSDLKATVIFVHALVSSA